MVFIQTFLHFSFFFFFVWNFCGHINRTNTRSKNKFRLKRCNEYRSNDITVKFLNKRSTILPEEFKTSKHSFRKCSSLCVICEHTSLTRMFRWLLRKEKLFWKQKRMLENCSRRRNLRLMTKRKRFQDIRDLL